MPDIKPNRCSICKRKISLIDTIISCRCQETLCKDHIYNHNCTFDYKKSNQEILAKQLIAVKDSKIEKI